MVFNEAVKYSLHWPYVCHRIFRFSKQPSQSGADTWCICAMLKARLFCLCYKTRMTLGLQMLPNHNNSDDASR